MDFDEKPVHVKQTKPSRGNLKKKNEDIGEIQNEVSDKSNESYEEG